MNAKYHVCRHCRKKYVWRERSMYCSITCSEERGFIRRAQFGKASIQALLILEERGEAGILEENAWLKSLSRKRRPMVTARIEETKFLYVPRFRLTRFGRAVVRYWRKKGLIDASLEQTRA